MDLTASISTSSSTSGSSSSSSCTSIPTLDEADSAMTTFLASIVDYVNQQAKALDQKDAELALKDAEIKRVASPLT